MTTKTNTKPAPTRCLWQQGFRDALQRLSVTLMLVMLTATTAWAQVTLQAYTDDVLSDTGGTIEFNNNNPNSHYVTVTANEGYRIDRVVHENGSTAQTLNSDGMGNYYFNSNSGTITAYFVTITYTVSFYANGGTGSMDAVSQKHGTSYTIPDCGFTNSGYYFVGWATSASGDVVYYPGNIITSLTANLKLYAKWGYTPYTVSFNANGGTGTMVDVTTGSLYTIPECSFTKSGYTFVGWATTSDGDVAYTPGQTITLTGGLTLYAVWIENPTVTFYANGGEGSMDAVRPNYGSSYEIPSCSFTKDGYTFIGWAISAEGDVVYTPGKKITLTTDLTLYAIWRINRTISFNANGGTGTMNAVTQADGTNYTIPECSFTRDGYSFVGWATSTDGAVEYNPGAVTTLTGDLTLYAKWADTSENYVVLFNANGGTGTMAAVEQPKNSSYTIPTCSFTRERRFFIGWATSADGAVEYLPGDNITLTDNLTLYAKWGGINVAFTVNGLRYKVTSVSPSTVEVYKIDGSKPTGELNIPATVAIAGTEFSVTSIAQSVFKGCIDLTTVNIPDGVTSIGHSAFYNCKALTTVNIPDGVTSIGDNTFYDCEALTTVNIPDGVTSIGKNAFKFCYYLSVNIPSCLTSIGEAAFLDCYALQSVTIPAGVTSIGKEAFKRCYLMTVTIYAPSLTEYGVDAFDNNASGRKIYVFSDCVETYKSKWSKYANAIEAIPALAVRDAGGELGSWCTYYNGLADVTVAEGTTVYTAKQNNAGGVTLTETGSRVIKRGEAVLLKSTADVVLSSAADSGTGTYTDNELKGVDCETAQDANTTYYVLSKVNGVFGFYKLKNTVNLGANKAYLAVATPPSLAPAYFGFDEGTTNILNTDFTDNTDKAGAIYDLQGRKIANGQKPNAKGLYIVNGKKMVIK